MHKPTIHKKGQAGQAIVLIAIIMVALVASLGLAIDGGGMYLLYRDAQNAVDAAALTAAFALCTDADPVQAGLDSLELNGFDSARVGATMEVNNPPLNGTYAGQADKVEIIVNVVKPSYFIQIVYGGPLTVNVDAISQCAAASSTTASSVDEQYAFRSIRDADECSSSVAWDIAGSQFTIEGDVWMPNIGTNIEFNSNNTPDPTVADNPADIIGDIYVGRSSAQQAITDGNGRQTLVEDLPGSPAGAPFPSYSGYGGDGVIEFSQPEPAPLPYTMDYFRPAGSSLCTTAECGGLQALYPAQYHDVSAVCASGNKVEYQDFGQNMEPWRFDFAPYYDVPNSEWTPGIYYSTCQISLNHSNMNGNVTFISEEQIDMSNNPYSLTAYGDAPLMVTNKNSTGSSASNPDVQNCSGGSYALQLNADGSYLQGRIIAFRGYIAIQGNNFVLETCISAAGIKQNGNSNSIYRCIPGTTTPSMPGEIGIVE